MIFVLKLKYFLYRKIKYFLCLTLKYFYTSQWNIFADFVPATATTFKVSMSPWTNYTFRVIARNKVGDSLPSGHSKVCKNKNKFTLNQQSNTIKALYFIEYTLKTILKNNLNIWYQKLDERLK